MPNVNPSGLSRRSFLEMSAGTIAEMAVLSMPHISFATSSEITSTSLAKCPENPDAAIKLSKMINDGWSRLLNAADSITDTALSQNVKKVLNDPSMTFMQQYDSSSAVQSIYAKLLDNGLIDKNKITAKTLFPPLKNPMKPPQPFITAPGSGYDSHHAYPGGLVMHTLNNTTIAQGICKSYSNNFLYNVNYNTAIAGEILHDIAKPWVFQWQPNGASLVELPIAMTGSHHIFSLAESIYRGFPPDVIVAQACAHDHPGTSQDEALVVGWLKSAAYIAQKDPIKLGLLASNGETLPLPHKQEGFIVHLGDHDWVLSVPASQESAAMLQQIAKKEYGMDNNAMNKIDFNKFRNYIGSQVSFMCIHHALSQGTDPYQEVLKIVKQIITA